MNTSNCSRIDDAGSYVLGAMADDDADAYRYHLGDCECCSAKVAELEFVSATLLSGVPQLTAPPQIRARVMAVVHSEAQLLQAAGAGADRPARASSPSRFGRFARRPLVAVAMACALLAVGLGSGALLSGGGGPGRETVLQAKVDPQLAPGGRAELRTRAGGGAKLVVTGIHPPAEGRIYQVWLDRPNDNRPPLPTDAFFSVNNRGTASVDVPGDLKGVSDVLVTSEPQGGSRVPSGPAVIDVATA